MITFSNGNSYRLVYLDTNSINEISKNTRKMGKIFMERFCVDNFMFVTSCFNLFELSKTKGDTRKNIIKFFNIFPLAIMYTFPQLIEFEKSSSKFNQEMIMFATGPSPLFNFQFSDILNLIENDSNMDKALKKMKQKFEKEIVCLRQKQTRLNWNLKFKKNLLESMNDTFKFEENYFEIKELGKYKSLEVLAFIMNQFIYESNKTIEINSVIDAYNCSILPYVEFYITEKTVGSWLDKAKYKFKYLQNIEIIKIKDLME